MTEAVNEEGIETVLKFVTTLRSGIKRQYDRGVNRDLSRQNAQNLFGRNTVQVLRQCFEDTLSCIRGNATVLDVQDVTEIVTSFNGIIDELFEYALTKHRTSCAFSNFPAEHNPAPEYISEVLDEVSRELGEFQQKLQTPQSE